MTIVEQPRQFCALSGQQTILAIERAIPIVHAGPGCSSMLFGGLAMANGFQGSGYAGGGTVPSTNTTEREVVFGGTDRLRDVIEGALKVLDADLFVVLTGCTTDLIGDDVGAVVGAFQDRGIPIAHASTGGFRGSTCFGHETVVRALIEQILEPAPEPIPGLVNVWSVIPYKDTFWAGNLHAIRELLEGIGLEANILFGHASGGLTAWRRIPAAQFNLVVSPWVGLTIAQDLQTAFGTPFLHVPVFPIGAVESSRFLREVGAFAGVESQIVERYIDRAESLFYHYLDRAADFFLEARWDLPDRFVNIADSLYALGIARFLVNELGFLPGHQFITDDPPEEHRPALTAALAHLAEHVSAEVTYSHDGGEIARTLRADTHSDERPIIFGTSWDRDIARELRGYCVSVNLPITDRLILDRGYGGYAGGLHLMEDMYASVLARQQ
jgi:nitrogenase molybdenum-iron protein beta chain